MNGLWLADDQTILDQAPDVLARVGVADLVDFIGIQPNLILAAVEDLSGQVLLHTEIAENVINNIGQFATTTWKSIKKLTYHRPWCYTILE